MPGCRLPAALPFPCLQVVLAALWLLASGLLPLGCQDCAAARGQQGPARLLARPRRLAAKLPCPPGMNWVDAVHRCCPQCPAGERCAAGTARCARRRGTALPRSGRAPCHPAACTGTYLKTPCSIHLNDSHCDACSDGTYLSQPNTRSKCDICYECDHHGELAVPRAALCRAVPCHPAHPHTRSFPDRAQQLLGHQQRRLRLRARLLPQLPERALQRIHLQQVPALPGKAD